MAEHNRLALGAAAAALMVGASPEVALAQSGAGARDLEVVVTARKKEERLIDAPVSVSAFGAADLERLQVESIDDIARFAPGLSFSKAFGRSTDRPVIRGQSNVLASVQFGVESGTAYFIDGVYFPSTIQTIDPNEIERVEVVRGPQSALYGRNTYAGAINVITKGASDDFDAVFKASAGERNEYEASVSLAWPMGENAGFRFSMRHYEYGGEYTNQVTQKLVGQESSFSAAGTLLWDLTPNFSTRTRFAVNKDRDGVIPLFLQPATENNCEPGTRSLASYPGFASTNNFQYFCGVIKPRPVALNTDNDADGIPNLIPGISNTATLPGPFRPVYDLRDGTAFDGIRREQYLLSHASDWDIGGSGYTLSGLFGMRFEDDMFGSDSDHSSVNWFRSAATGETFFANTNRDKTDDYSVEVKLASPTDNRFRFMLGGFLYDQKNDGTDITFFDLQGANGVGLVVTETENKAVFGLVEADIMTNLTATLEARYAEETKKDTSGAPGFREATFDKFAPRATLSYKFANGGNVYGVYAVGVKPGGLNGATGAAVNIPAYDQEESDNFELGVKVPLGERFRVGVAAYYSEATKVQLTTAVQTPAGAVNSVASNQGDGEIQGLELEFSGDLTPNLFVGFNYAYTKPEFTAGCDPDEWTLTSGGGTLLNSVTCTGTTRNGRGSGSIAGRRYPLTSENQASAFFDYRQPFGNDSAFYLGGNVSYESSKFVQVHNRAETGDATLVGAQAGVEFGRVTLGLWGRNLTDEDSITLATRWLQSPAVVGMAQVAGNPSPGAPRAFFGSLRRGRQAGVELKVDF
jgi:outer membrane receptor protein involved in Fe transport